ncbi:MAG: hypothetical protein Sapg2KO_02710 [Saprospiraceae bacterium]
MKNQITTLVILTILFGSCAQQTLNLNRLEGNLLKIRQQYLDSAYNYNDYSDSLANNFSSELLAKLASVEASFDYPFDSLKTKVKICNSPDGLLKTYSWYHTVGGGTWHDLWSVAQYKTENSIDTFALSLGTAGITGDPIDVSYYKIQILKEGATQIYLLSGWGTHGGGHHYKIIRALKIQDHKLVDMEAIFNGEKYLSVKAPRGNEITITYDEKTQSITYDLFIQNQETGFYKVTGKQIRLMWNGQAFKAKK